MQARFRRPFVLAPGDPTRPMPGAHRGRRARLRAIVAAVAIALVMTRPGTGSISAAGDLDPTFGVNGVVITDLGGEWAEAHGVAVQADGKIVVVGSKRPGACCDFVVARHNTDGTLDTTFGGAGVVVTDLAYGESDSEDYAYAVAIDANGKILVGGSTRSRISHYQEGANFAMVRYNTDGSVDTMSVTDLTPPGPTPANAIHDEEIQAIAIDPATGKIVVAGHMFWLALVDDNGNFRQHADVAVARYNADLSFDKSIVTDVFPDTPTADGDDEATGVAIQADGKIVISGWTDVLEGPSAYNFLVGRYDADLNGLDPTFGSNGLVTTDFFGLGNDVARGIALQADGKIVVTGNATDSSRAYIGLVRYDGDGTLDSTFGANGKVATYIQNSAGGLALAIQPDGRSVVAGASAGTSADITVARYTTDGTLDGTAITDIAGHHDVAFAVALQPDGKIIAAGRTPVDNGTPDGRDTFVVVRYDDLHLAKTDPVITWNNPADIIWGTALSATQLNATADVAGTLAYTPAAGTVLNAGNGQTLHVDFTPTDSTHYNSASKDVLINVLKASPSISINDIPSNAKYPGGFTATYAYAGDGTPSTTSSTPGVCTASGNAVTFVAAGTCALVGHATATSNVNAATGSSQSFTIGLSIAINNIPANPVFGGSFTATYSYAGNGKTSATSSTTSVCTVSTKGLIKFVSAGTCTLTAHATATSSSPAANGDPQSFTVGKASTTISIKTFPRRPKVGTSFTATYNYVGDGSPFVTSSTPATCTVSGASVVQLIGAGTCTLTAHATAGAHYLATDGQPQSFTVQP